MSKIPKSSISIGIITRNRAEDLYNCVKSFIQQPSCPQEILVIDSSTDNATTKRVNELRLKFRRIIYIYEPRKGYSLARNLVLQHCTSHWLAFIDDDCVAHRYWYNAVQHAIRQHPNAAAIAGFSHTMYEQNMIARTCEVNELFWKTNARRGDRIYDLETLDTKNVIYNMTFIRLHRLRFDTGPIGRLGADDCDMGMQIMQKGGLAFFEERALVYHKDIISLAQYVHWRIARTLSHALYEQKWYKFRKTITLKKQNKLLFVLKYAKNNHISTVRTLCLLVLLVLTYFLIRYAKIINALSNT